MQRRNTSTIEVTVECPSCKGTIDGLEERVRDLEAEIYDLRRGE